MCEIRDRWYNEALKLYYYAVGKSNIVVALLKTTLQWILTVVENIFFYRQMYR